MNIITCYTVGVKGQLSKDGVLRRTDDWLMRETSGVCLDALMFCVDTFLAEWGYLSSITDKLLRRRAGDVLIHSTKGSAAKYPEFDKRFPCFPSYMRRAVVADALGMVSSYVSNHKRWEEGDSSARGREPVPGFPSRYELTFYDQERDMSDLKGGAIRLKLYDGKSWGWHRFVISGSDARYIESLRGKRTMLSPVVEKVRGRCRIRFSFREKRGLVEKDPLDYRILAVDLGINAAASWAVMTADGAVHGRGVIRLSCEEGRLQHLMNRKKLYQRSGKRSGSIYRRVNAANRQMSIETARAVMEAAELYSVDCVVFEYLDRTGRKYSERIHHWRANDVQARVEAMAHRGGMRISRVCAWGTSKYAFDGSGEVRRGRDAGLGAYSLCRFRNGKIYNCDLSAALNIGARHFLRDYVKLDSPKDFPKTPQRTYASLIKYLNGRPAQGAA